MSIFQTGNACSPLWFVRVLFAFVVTAYFAHPAASQTRGSASLSMDLAANEEAAYRSYALVPEAPLLCRQSAGQSGESPGEQQSAQTASTADSQAEPTGL